MDKCEENKDATNQLSLSADNMTNIIASQFKDSTCKWQITAPAGYIVQVNVYRAKFTGSSCDEYVKVYDGKTMSDKLIVEYCPTKRRRPSNSLMWSTSENIMLEFKQGSAVGNNALNFIVTISKAPKGKIYYFDDQCLFKMYNHEW